MTETKHGLVPSDKFDLERAKAAAAAGYPAVAEVLPELVAWLKDYNWPVAKVLAPFLATIGLPLLPHVKAAFASGDAIWEYWVLRKVVATHIDLAAAIRPQLENIVACPTPDEVAEDVLAEAREILQSLGAA
jgi:hypothetical protein